MACTLAKIARIQIYEIVKCFLLYAQHTIMRIFYTVLVTEA